MYVIWLQLVRVVTALLLLVLPGTVGPAERDASAPIGPADAGAEATRTPATQPFAATSPWNTPTLATTEWFDTPSLHVIPNGQPTQWFVGLVSLAIYHGVPTDPVWTFAMPDYIATGWGRSRPAETFLLHAPADLMAGADSDHVLVLIDDTTDDFIEVWNTAVDPDARMVTTGSGDQVNAGGVGWATGNTVTGPGAGTSTGSNDGVRASNFSWIGGAITGADLRLGTIDHALVVSLPAYALMGGAGGLSSFLPPATAIDNGAGAGPIRMGSKIGIPATTPRPDGLTPLGNALFDTLQRYGAYVGDACGGDWPMLYIDEQTVTEADIAPLQQWNGGLWSVLGPLLRVADYQP